ncbi:MAG TPA: hypothetical protein VLF59_00140 [Candidatus Saccharimonadales bacterium]|nr:hypothetical protein [Candidatus Saccharimonadales bacterium]
MIAPEANPQEILQDISERFSFDSFVHFACLAALSQDTGIPPSQWPLLLEAWDYHPGAFLQEHKRGTCINFATYTQDRLAQAGHATLIIGELASAPLTQRQRDYVRYTHTSLLASSAGERILYEPGWSIPYPVPIRPVGEVVMAGKRRFTTMDIKEDTMIQQTVSPSGRTSQRTLSFQPLAADETIALTKRIRRIPLALEIYTTLSPDIPRQFIALDPGASTYKTNIDGLPNPFTLQELAKPESDLISRRFGFDVKEELLAVDAFRKQLPKEFWV